jgi:hypothetical protein
MQHASHRRRLSGQQADRHTGVTMALSLIKPDGGVPEKYIARLPFAGYVLVGG